MHLVSWGPEEVAADVFGSQRYSVVLTRVSKDLFGLCTCAFFQGGNLCKHIWATVLAVDARQGLRGPGSTLPTRLLPKADSQPPRRPDRSAHRRQPDWRQLLEQAPDAEPAPYLEPGLVYVVDLPATMASQELTVDLMAGEPRPEGVQETRETREALRPLRLARFEISRLANPADRQILSLLAEPEAEYAAELSSLLHIPTRYGLPFDAAGLILPLLCATGHCQLRRGPGAGGAAEAEPLTWDDGEPWQLRVEVAEDAAGSCSIAAWLHRGEERLSLRHALLLLASGVAFTANRALRFDHGGTFGSLKPLRQMEDLRVPAAEREELVERLLEAPTLPPLDLPERLRVEEARPIPRPQLRLQARSESPRSSLLGELSFLYEGHEVPVWAPRRGVYLREERRFLRRDQEAERRAAGRLQDLGFRPSRDGDPGKLPIELASGRAPAVLLTLLREGWSVEAQGVRYRSPGSFRLGIATGVDWFELHGEAEFEGATARLPALLAALRRGEGFVPLEDGSLGLLPRGVARQGLAPVAGLRRARGRPPEVPAGPGRAARRLARPASRRHPATKPSSAPGNASRLRGGRSGGSAAGVPRRAARLPARRAWLAPLPARLRLRRLPRGRHGTGQDRPGARPAGVPPPVPGKGGAALSGRGAALADLQLARRGGALHAGAARPRPHRHGPHSGRGPFAGCDLVLTTYGTLRRDIEALRQVEFDYVILDEAQAIKNAGSQTAKAARLLRGRHRLALSGTPIENHLGELWSLLEFLNPGLLGSGAAPAPADR